MIINFDDYRKTPVIYADELDKFNIARLHNPGEVYINTYIPDMNYQPSILSTDTVFADDNTLIKNGISDYLKNFYNEQRQIEMSNDYERYCRQSWRNEENNKNKGE